MCCFDIVVQGWYVVSTYWVICFSEVVCWFNHTGSFVFQRWYVISTYAVFQGGILFRHMLFFSGGMSCRHMLFFRGGMLV